MREAFAKASHLLFNKKYWHISDINFRNFNQTLTNNVVSLEPLGLDVSVERISICNVIEKLKEHAYIVCHAPVPVMS